MLVPFYWVLKTSLTGENIFAYPPALLPARARTSTTTSTSGTTSRSSRFLMNSVVVSLIVVVANLVFNAMAGYALTLDFRGKRAFSSCSSPA